MGHGLYFGTFIPTPMFLSSNSVLTKQSRHALVVLDEDPMSCFDILRVKRCMRTT